MGTDLDFFLIELNKFDKEKEKERKYEDDEDFIPGGRKKSRAKKTQKRKPRAKKEKEMKQIKIDEISKEINNIDISDVDLLPEDTDDELGPSKIGGLAKEMHNSLSVSASPFVEARDSPKKGGRRKRKKQVTPKPKNLIYANYLLVTIIFYLCLFGV